MSRRINPALFNSVFPRVNRQGLRSRKGPLLRNFSSEFARLEDRLAPVVNIVATMQWSLAADNFTGGPATGTVNQGDVIRYTVGVSNTGDTGATNVVFADDKIDALTTLIDPSIKISPLPLARSFKAVGNTPLTIAVGSGLRSGIVDLDPVGATPNGSLVIGKGSLNPSKGAVAINADGSFTYTPNVGIENTTDTFTYTITDLDGMVGTGTVTIDIGERVWYVDNKAAAGGTGTFGSRFDSLADVTGVTGPDTTNDIIYLVSTGTAYTGGITLLANQQLIGGGVALTVNTINVFAAGANSIVQNAGGNAVTFVDGATITGLSITSASGGGLVGTGVNALTVDPTVAISGVSGTDIDISGGSGTFNIPTILTNTAGRSVSIANRTGGTVTFSGAISDTGTGISLTNNTGATINFTGGVTLSTGVNAAFAATGGGTVSITGANNTAVTSTGTALNVTNTTIGASGLTFKSISCNGAANGILLNNTGATAGLTVTGNGNTTQGGDNSGGTIQNTTGVGVSLTNTQSPSFTNLRILNTVGHGVGGTDVTNFTFQYGTIDGAKIDALTTSEESNIGFYINETNSTRNNLDGTVTIVGNILTNAQFHGIDIFNFSGTVANATISNNKITSATLAANSQGSAIRLIGFGTATTVASVTKATIDGNTVNNFPSGAGIMVQGGNANSPSAMPGTYGTSSASPIAITNNVIAGASPTNRIATQGILTAVNGRGTGFFTVTNNSVSNTLGTSIAVSSFGFATVTAILVANTVVANNTVGSQGIGAGTGITFANTDMPTLNLRIGDGTAGGANKISQTDGNGILVVARDCTGKCNVRILTNTVAAPLGGVRPGIRLDAGNTNSVDDEINAEISGNTSAGSGGTNGIGLRKQGIVSTTNDFKVVGMSATSTPGVETYVNGQNPAGNGTLLISATSGFSAGTPMSFLIAAPEGIFPDDAATATPQPVVPMGAALAPNESHDADGPSQGVEFGLSTPNADDTLTAAALHSLTSAAIRIWANAGLTAEQLRRLESVSFHLAEMPGFQLGAAEPGRVTLDVDAAGYGWFIDHTPFNDGEFTNGTASTRLYADAMSPAAGHLDLLTTVMHELGHQLGLDDTYDFINRNSVMFGYLTLGERRLPAPGEAIGAVPHEDHDHGSDFMFTPLNIGKLDPGSTVTIKFEVKVNDPLAHNVTTVSNQGRVEFDTAQTKNTDDPTTGTANDATVTPILVVNRAPTVANAIPDQVFTGVGSKSFQFAANTFADLDADPLTYSAKQVGGAALPTWLTFTPGTRTFAGNPGSTDTTPLQIRVTADDGFGGSVFDDFQLTLMTVNDAPVLTPGTPALTGIKSDITVPANVGDTISTLIGARITDGDALDSRGVAVTAVTLGGGGKWQYALNGTTFVDFPAVTATAPLLLNADGDTRIRFFPTVQATSSASVTWRAWDRTAGGVEGASSSVDPGAGGGGSAFSTATENATIQVTDATPPAAPVVTAPAGPVFVNTTPFNVAGTAEANAKVEIYSDANNDGIINGTDAVVATQQLSGGATAFSIPVTLSLNAANNFLVTATDSSNNKSAVADVPTITHDNVVPTASVKVNDGTAQRSRVTSLTVTFSERMLLPAPPQNAFTLIGPNGAVTLSADTVTLSTPTQTTAVLTFSGVNTEFTSLKDGNYTLTVLANQATDVAGNLLDGDGNGTGGDNRTLNLHRLFGDSNGDKTVSAVDFNAFRLAFGQAGPSMFDFDGDNQITAADFNEFRTRYGVTI